MQRTPILAHMPQLELQQYSPVPQWLVPQARPV
jgi:hypothetical protein